MFNPTTNAIIQPVTVINACNRITVNKEWDLSATDERLRQAMQKHQEWEE